MNLEGVYHDLRKISPEKARSLLLRVLERNHKNISRTARILSISRNTVYRALKGPLHDLPRTPKYSPSKTPRDLESLILSEAKRTGYRYRRLSAHLWNKYGLKISEKPPKPS